MEVKQLDIFTERSGTKKVKCKCCGHVSYEYHRKYNSNMALALLILYVENTNEFVHLENLIISKGHKRCGDFSYLVYYNHIQKMDAKREDGSKRNGMYRITGIGRMFCEMKTYVNERFIMKDGAFHGFEGRMINISDALSNKFRYDELMDNKN